MHKDDHWTMQQPGRPSKPDFPEPEPVTPPSEPLVPEQEPLTPVPEPLSPAGGKDVVR